MIEVVINIIINTDITSTLNDYNVIFHTGNKGKHFLLSIFYQIFDNRPWMVNLRTYYFLYNL